MKYIYDVLLNFNETRGYEFYEWNSNDDIEYFKKVPIVKVDSDTYQKIRIGNVIDDSTFLDKISNVSEIYDNKLIRRVKFACILTDGELVSAALLENRGKIIMISKMLLDEEEEVIEISNTINVTPINITNNNINSDNGLFLTRSEIYKNFFLNKEIDSLYDSKNTAKLKYLYYECSNVLEDDIDIIYNKLKEAINGWWGSKQNNLYDLVRLSYSKR